MLESFLTVTQQVAILAILIAVGFICGKTRLLKEQAIKGMTDFVLYIVSPCVIIGSFQREWDAALAVNLLIMVAAAVAVLTLSIAVAHLLLRDPDDSRRAVLRFGAVFSNCGFMSLPLQQVLLGADGVFYGAAFIAVFTVFSWTYGLWMMSGDRKQLSFRRLLTNPGIIGTAIGFLLFVLQVRLPLLLMQPVEYFSALNTPVPMVIIGFYLAQANLLNMLRDKGVYGSLGIRLLLMPLITIGAILALPLPPTVAVALTIAVSAPTAANTTMFATKFGRDPVLAVNLVSLTTVVSLVTMPLMISLAQWLTR